MRKLTGILRRFLTQDPKAEENFQLVALWRNWDDVMGPLAPFMRPLGRKKRTLLVGAETPLDLQEIGYFAPEIVTNANAFLAQDFFDKVQASLIMDRTSLDAVGVKLPLIQGRGELPAIMVGNVKDRMEPGSPVEKCYQAYVRFLGGKGE